MKITFSELRNDAPKAVVGDMQLFYCPGEAPQQIRFFSTLDF